MKDTVYSAFTFEYVCYYIIKWEKTTTFTVIQLDNRGGDMLCFLYLQKCQSNNIGEVDGVDVGKMNMC